MKSPNRILDRSAMGGTLKLLGRHLAGQQGRVTALAAVILASNALKLVNPRVLRSFIDAIAGGSPLAELYGHAAIFIAIALGVQGIAILATWLGQGLGWTSTNALRLELVGRTLALDLSWHKDHLPGELVDRIDGDSGALMSFFSDFSIRLLGSALLLVGVLASLYLENRWIGLGMTFYAAIGAFVLIKIGLFAIPWWRRNREKSAEFYGLLGERIAGREDLQGLGAQGYARRRVHGLLTSWYPVRRRANLLRYSMWTSAEFVWAIGLLVSLGLGAFFWRRGAISLGTVFLVYNYANLVMDPLEQLQERLEDLQKALACTARICEFLDLRPEIAYGARELGASALSLEFRDVGFGYEKGAPVLRALSFELPPGGRLGVAGRTGSGKTTIGRLALRLHDRGEGSILLDGRPVEEYSRSALRKRLAVVTQEVEIFTGTIRDNASMWDRGAGDDDILAAFRELGLDGWLSGYPRGLDERIGPGGAGLSAGQAQLLAMVRVFLRDPGLVILDEASSRLDPATETLLEGAIDRLLEGRSAIIIAHRLSTLERAERVLVLDGGRAVELGDRLALASDPTSRYSRLLRAGLGEGGEA